MKTNMITKKLDPAAINKKLHIILLKAELDAEMETKLIELHENRIMSWPSLSLSYPTPEAGILDDELEQAIQKKKEGNLSKYFLHRGNPICFFFKASPLPLENQEVEAKSYFSPE